MATYYSANQYDGAFTSAKLQNWNVPKHYKERPSGHDGFTQFITDDRGHLLPGVPRSKTSPWGTFMGTWDMPPKIPPAKVNLTSRSADASRRLSDWIEKSGSLVSACNGLRPDVTGKVCCKPEDDPQEQSRGPGQKSEHAPRSRSQKSEHPQCSPSQKSEHAPRSRSQKSEHALRSRSQKNEHALRSRSQNEHALRSRSQKNEHPQCSPSQKSEHAPRSRSQKSEHAPPSQKPDSPPGSGIGGRSSQEAQKYHEPRSGSRTSPYRDLEVIT